MNLSPGTRLGSYGILSPPGAGGMGEVYRARDTKLGREVAMKVLPADSTSLAFHDVHLGEADLTLELTILITSAVWIVIVALQRPVPGSEPTDAHVNRWS
jgi:serine/threonine protein kinase